LAKLYLFEVEMFGSTIIVAEIDVTGTQFYG